LSKRLEKCSTQNTDAKTSKTSTKLVDQNPTEDDFDEVIIVSDGFDDADNIELSDIFENDASKIDTSTRSTGTGNNFQAGHQVTMLLTLSLVTEALALSAKSNIC
jgi:hypothetical protein